MSKGLICIVQLTNNGQKEIRQAAEKALEVRRLLESGRINQREYEELLDDVADMDTIDTSMLTEDCLLTIKQAFDLILTLKSMTSLL